ncbi:hypothetical protein BQ8794_50401 [Mesorhizobium prunaredense]|uniref:Uncharacterized protein n=1 Tax=Mesorhizobium prunaredense TaxID=1631249 RepID=A0A1R3VEG4_9HYPH|nr:hypothetical protein BQ8794_50401 [Mesorhizobium prunaredense]
MRPANCRDHENDHALFSSAAETFAGRRLRIAYGIAAPVLLQDRPARVSPAKARSTVAVGRLSAWFLIALPDCEFGPG